MRDIFYLAMRDIFYLTMSDKMGALTFKLLALSNRERGSRSARSTSCVLLSQIYTQKYMLLWSATSVCH